MSKADDSRPSSPETPKETVRPKRKAPQPRLSKTLITTAKAGLFALKLKQELAYLLDAAALTEANRRRRTEIDIPDYQDGFDLLVNPSRNRVSISIAADLVGATGTLFIGFAISTYTSSSPNWSVGHMAMIAGATMLISGIFFKYLAPTR